MDDNNNNGPLTFRHHLEMNLSKRDAQFLQSVYSGIEEDLLISNSKSIEQLYIAHKAAFDKIVGYVVAYKPILTAIKAEYEDLIESVKRGQKEADFLQRKVEALAVLPTTLHNYKRRNDDLTRKVEILSSENQRLQKDLLRLKSICEEQEKEKTVQQNHEKQKCQSNRRKLPGMSIDEMTDVVILKRELANLEKQLLEFRAASVTRFQPRGVKLRLTDSLQEKVQRIDFLTDQLACQTLKHSRLQTIVNATQAYRRVRPYHQNFIDAIQKALFMAPAMVTEEQEALNSMLHENSKSGTQSSIEDDPNWARESELVLDYLEKFQELLVAEDYIAAVRHAANSPRGILRTMNTLLKFKQLEMTKSLPTGSLVLNFAEAVLSTVPAFGGVRPTADISFEFVQAALECHKVDLVQHWLSNDRLTLTKVLGDLLESYATTRPQKTELSLELAQHVFESTANWTEAVGIALRCGRIVAGIELARRNKLLGDVKNDGDNMQVTKFLKEYPTKILAAYMFSLGLAKFEILLTALIDVGAWSEACELVEDHVCQLVNDEGMSSSEAARQLVAENESVSADIWTELATRGPVDAEHLQNVMTSALVKDAVERSFTTLENLLHENN